MADTLTNDPKELRRLLREEREAHVRRAGELVAMQRADRRLREILSAVSPLADIGWLADAPINAAAYALAMQDDKDPDLVVEVSISGGLTRLPQWHAYLPQATSALVAARKAVLALSMGLGERHRP